jgi:hypothetical protein
MAKELNPTDQPNFKLERALKAIAKIWLAHCESNEEALDEAITDAMDLVDSPEQ